MRTRSKQWNGDVQTASGQMRLAQIRFRSRNQKRLIKVVNLMTLASKSLWTKHYAFSTGHEMRRICTNTEFMSVLSATALF